MSNEVRTVHCPRCQHLLTLRDLRAGRFRITCPECQTALVVRVVLEPTPMVAVEPAPGSEGPSPAALGAAPPASPPVVVGPAPLVPLPSGEARQVGPYRLVGVGAFVLGGIGRVGRWLGFGPLVGLLTVRPASATDAPFLAAWTLEVLAARALRHPNLSPPGDLIEANGHLWATQPLGVMAAPLSDPTRGRADLDRSARLAAILHAARALRHAHEQGVGHHAVGLDTIVVDPEGLVTLLSLGGNLTPGALASAPGSAATPGPPPPTPALAVPGVDPPPPPPAPAVGPPPVDPFVPGEIGDLGRALATLVAGEAGDRAVPPGLAHLIRCLDPDGGIDPRERPRDLGAVVRLLEDELGVGLPWHPPAPEAEAFLATLAEPEPPLARVCRLGLLGLLGLVVLVSLPLLARGAVGPVLALAVLAGGTALGLTLLRAWPDRHRYSERLAEALGVLNRRDAVTLALVALIGVVTLVGGRLVGPTVLLLALAGGLAAGVHFGLDRPVALEEADRRDRLRALVRLWRRSGADEQAIRRFAAPLATTTRRRARLATLWPPGAEPSVLGPLGRWLASRWGAWIAERRGRQARVILEPILERAFEARGVQTLTARRRSKRAAEAVVAVAEQYRRAPDATVGLPLRVALQRATERPEDFLQSPEIAEAAGPSRLATTATWLAETLLGPHVRFVVGAACLAMSLSWLEQNHFWAFDRVTEAARTAAFDRDHPRALDQIRDAGNQFSREFSSTLAGERQAEPLPLPGVPLWLERLLNDGFALAAVGLILVLSATVGGLRIIALALGAAVVPFVPRLALTGTRPLDGPSLGALGLALVGFALAWRAERRRVG